MRIDNIDLYGKLLINGSTGSEGQILTYGNQGFSWGTASASGSGSTSSYFKTIGYNYVICETVNTGNPSADALTNGTNLQNAYNLAKTLDVGTKSTTNRVTVMLMPGDYDLGDTGQFQLDTSFIDIVGISSNPYHTKLRSSTQIFVIQYTNPVDSALKNVYLYNSNTFGTHLVDDDDGNVVGSYLRWENLLLKGYLFSDGVSWGFSNIYGEFKNIKILDESYNFAAGDNINAIFDNIEANGNNYYSLISAGNQVFGSTLTGTFSNIKFNSPGTGCFYTNGIISGNYENINILIANDVFQAGSINGTFKNIIISNSYSGTIFISYVGNLYGTYENIQILNANNTFNSSSGEIYGNYKDIEISSYTCFNTNGVTISGVFENIKFYNTSISTNGRFFYGGSISGEFRNIEVGGDNDEVFKSSDKIEGIYENIKIGNVRSSVFESLNGISGTFKKIKIGDIMDPFQSNNSFYGGEINGTFDEIKIGNNSTSMGSYFFSSVATMSGTFSNIEIGDCLYQSNIYIFYSDNIISGTYKNIKVGSSNKVFSAEYGLLVSMDNIEFGSSNYSFVSNLGNLLGTFSNIKTYSQQGNTFNGQEVIGTFENIEFSNIDSNNFYGQVIFSGTTLLSGTFRNIKIGDLSQLYGDIFFSGSSLTGIFENIEVGNGSGSNFDIFKANGGNISGTFSNITVGDNFQNVFLSSGNISGFYKDITIGNSSGFVFYQGSEISIGTTIDNLYSFTGIYDSTHLKGRLINSTIIDSSSIWLLSIDVSVSPLPIVENCKLITGGTGTSILPVNGTSSNIQVLYTATNEGFNTAGGDSLMTPNFNITDAGLT